MYHSGARMLVVGETVLTWGQEAYGHSPPSAQFWCEPKAALKNSLFKKINCDFEQCILFSVAVQWDSKKRFKNTKEMGLLFLFLRQFIYYRVLSIYNKFPCTYHLNPTITNPCPIMPLLLSPLLYLLKHILDITLFHS